VNPKALQKRLLRVLEADHGLLVAWREGVDLTRATGRELQELQRRGVVARWSLARDLLKQADLMMAQAPPLYRSAVSRFYYSMYHSMRAVAYIAHDGDDHEKHATLPGKTPGDFPNAALWQNSLKSARDYRNQADYDPYPRADTAWRKTAESLGVQAHELVPCPRVSDP
jgi:uncharacterized protein (UPF0332 family)